MTVDELEALIAKVEIVANGKVYCGRNLDGTWFVSLNKDGRSQTLYYRSLPEIIAKLREWATPPKPETLTIEVPFSWAERRVAGFGFVPGDCERVDAICREAIKPWTQS